jgi:uncharacterized membrane protein
VDIGAVELLVIGFPQSQFTGEITPALIDLVEKGTIRVIDLIFVSKDQDGSIAGFELSSVDDATRRAFEPLLTDPEPLLHDDDLADVGEALAPGSSAAMLLFEHTWANEFRSALIEAGGELIEGTSREERHAI